VKRKRQLRGQAAEATRVYLNFPSRANARVYLGIVLNYYQCEFKITVQSFILKLSSFDEQQSQFRDYSNSFVFKNLRVLSRLRNIASRDVWSPVPSARGKKIQCVKDSHGRRNFARSKRNLCVTV